MAKLISGTRVYGSLTVDTSIILVGNTLNSVTGTGNTIVLGTSPTIGGHPTVEGVTSTGATGTGKFVFDTSPTLVTPTLGVATATTINKVTITAPATAATLTLANNSSFTTSGAFATTLTSTAATSLVLPTSGYLVATSGVITGTPSGTTFLRGDGAWSVAVQSLGLTFSAGAGNILSNSGTTSPITTTGTYTLSVAGTSGGIPYFSSTTAWNTSALLAANSFMVGGGAGSAPATILTGSGVVNAHGTAVNTTVTNSTTWFSGGTTATNTFVVASATGLAVGQYVSGTGLAAGTYVTNIVTTTVTVSNNFTVQAAGTYTFTGYGIVTQNSTLTSNYLVVGGGAGTGISTTTTGTGVVTALGIQTNTTNGLVTQTAALTSNYLVVGGGAGTGISTTTTGTGVVTAIGIQTNTTNGLVTQTAALTSNYLVVGGGSGTGISTTTTGAGVVTALGIQTNTTNGLVTQTAALTSNTILLGGGSGTGIKSTATGTGVVTALGINTGTDGAFVVKGGDLGTPTAATLTNATNLPISGIAGLGTNIATALGNNPTGTGNFVLDTSPTISLPAIDNIKLGFTTTATSGGTTSLTSASNAQQYFTGTDDHTVVLPSTSTLIVGQSYLLTNNSTQAITITTSTSVALLTQPVNTTVRYLVLSTVNNNQSSWDYYYTGFETNLVDTGTLNHLAYYASSSNRISSAPNAIFANSASQLQLGDPTYPAGKGGAVSLVGDASGGVVIQASTSATASSWIMTLPSSAGVSGQVLGTDGSGNTSWVDGGTGGGGSGGGAASVTVSSSAPGTPGVGDLWWNPTSSVLSIYESSGAGWVDASGNSQDWGYVTGLIYSYDDYGSIL
jgi:plasmid maintenance system antidote protein VapI